MNKICITSGMILLGWVGWWLGGKFGYGMVGKYFISSIGSLVGVYVGWFAYQRYLK